MIVLDANVVSELMKATADDKVRNWMLSQEDIPFSITAITMAEIEFGLQRLPDGQHKDRLYRRVETFTNALPVLPLDDMAGREVGRLRAIREAVGLPSQPSDMLIAGIVSTVGASLATRNTSDFMALPVSIIDPWTA